MDATDRPYQGDCDRQSLPSGVKMRENVQNEANPESTQSSSPLEVESSVPDPPGRKRSQREGDDTPRSTLHASRLTPTVASESGGSGERRVAPGGCREGEHETVVSRQWSVVSESGGGEGRAASGDSEDGEPERSEPTQEECRAPQNVPNEANPESTQSSLPLEVESSVPEPGRGQRSQSTQAVAREKWSVASGQWPVNAKRGRSRR